MPKTKISENIEAPQHGLLAWFRQHAFIVTFTAVFISLSTWIIASLYTYMMNPDGMSYFSIAQKYAEGDLRHAINGYWGPLLSWLLVPAVWLDLNLTVAAKVISILASAMFLILMYRFFEQRKVSRYISFFLIIALATYFFEWSIAGAIAPDVLMAALIGIFAISLSDFIKKPSPRLGIWLGVIGAALYFCKGFGFFLFVGIIGLTALWQWIKIDRKLLPVVKCHLPTVLTFLVLTVPFIAAISVKYNQPTINNAGTFNQHVNSPHYKGVQPIDVMGPLPLPNDSAVSPWEDPSIFIDLIPGWSPFESEENWLFFYYDIFYPNVLASLHFLYLLGPIMCVGFLAALMGAARKGKFRVEYVIIAGITIMMSVAYVVVFILDRYLWGGVVLAAMALGLWAQTLLERQSITKRQIVIVGVVICTVLCMITGKHITAEKRPHKDEHRSALNVKKVIPERSKVIADNFPIASHACFQANLSCYNVLETHPLDKQDEYYQSLKDMGIKYFLDYRTRKEDKLLQKFIKTYMKPIDKKVNRPSPTIYEIQ